MGLGGCTRKDPWVVFVGGPGYDRDEVDTDSLLLTAENPCGEQRLLDVTTPLRPIARYVGCVDAPQVLITSDVRSRTQVVPGGRRTFEHLSGCEENVESSQPRLKLRITSCGMGPYIIDSDSSLVVPGGPISIDVMGPAPWVELGSANIVENVLWTETSLRISACPAECCPCPPGVLTTWLQVPNQAVADQRIVLRPRRARGLSVYGRVVSGAPADVYIGWLHEAAGGLYGATTFLQTSQQKLEPVGAAPYAFVGLLDAPTFRATMRWEIAP